MKPRKANFYPPEGHDWVPTNDIRRARQHNDALAAEKYTHDVGAFRRRLFDTLIANKAICNRGSGWAMYATEDEGGVAVAGGRDVLLMSSPNQEESPGDCDVPSLRIITNEPVVTEAVSFYYTEDITVEPNGNARYLASGIRKIDENNIERFGKDLKISLAPLFALMKGQLVITNNFHRLTPIVNAGDHRNVIRPFGERGVLTDRIYALEKADGILDSVAGITPIGHLEVS